MSTAQATRPAKQKPWRSRHAFDPTRPVSYTHLTLPTIYSV